MTDPKAALVTAKAAHMAAAAQRWDEAVAGIRRVLNDPDPQVGELARRFFTVSGHTRWQVLGGVWQDHPAKAYGYGAQVPYDPCALMEFVATFVGYYLVKHCEPGVAYWRYAMEGDEEHTSETYILCTKDHPGARPYFHSCHELQQETDPTAERLTAARALEILDWYEQERVTKAAQTRAEAKDPNCPWDDEDLRSTVRDGVWAFQLTRDNRRLEDLARREREELEAWIKENTTYRFGWSKNGKLKGGKPARGGKVKGPKLRGHVPTRRPLMGPGGGARTPSSGNGRHE